MRTAHMCANANEGAQQQGAVPTTPVCGTMPPHAGRTSASHQWPKVPASSAGLAAMYPSARFWLPQRAVHTHSMERAIAPPWCSPLRGQCPPHPGGEAAPGVSASGYGPALSSSRYPPLRGVRQRRSVGLRLRLQPHGGIATLALFQLFPLIQPTQYGRHPFAGFYFSCSALLSILRYCLL